MPFELEELAILVETAAIYFKRQATKEKSSYIFTDPHQNFFTLVIQLL